MYRVSKTHKLNPDDHPELSDWLKKKEKMLAGDADINDQKEKEALDERRESVDI